MDNHSTENLSGNLIAKPLVEALENELLLTWGNRPQSQFVLSYRGDRPEQLDDIKRLVSVAYPDAVAKFYQTVS